MLNRNYRWIQYYDLVLHSYPATSPAIQFQTLVQPLQDHFASGNARQFVRNETAVCRIVDLRIDETRDVLILLFQYADKNISDPVFSALPTGKVRISEKQEEEGIAVSAHMMISLSETKPDSESYLTLIEQVPGLNRTQIQRFLTNQFKEVSDIIDLTYPNAKKQQMRQRPIATLRGYPSTSIREALRTGELKEFTFVKRSPVNREFDELAYAHEQIVRTTFKIGPDRTYKEKLTAVADMMKFAKRQNAEDIRIKFKDVDVGREHTVSIDEVPDEGTDEVSLVKSEKVSLDNPISDCEVAIHDGIIERMFELLSEMKH